jgi:hypothetical protein
MHHGSTKAGTLGGTLLGVIFHIPGEDLVTTSVLATVGAVVSYTVSFILKEVVTRVRRK